MRARIAVLLTLIAPSAFAIDYYTATLAPNEQTFEFSGGEAASAVVPPGRKPQCPAGRFLVSDHNRRPPLKQFDDEPFQGSTRTVNVVHWRNLGGTSIPSRGVSVFAPPPDLVEKNGNLSVSRARLWKNAGADHRLISLPNGDLLYQRVTLTREKMDPEPSWASKTFRGSFGPDARTTNATWRSTDCGLTFQYVGQIDSHLPGEKDCGNPQKLEKGVATPPFNVGGTDNPNLVVDRNGGTVYALLPCFGNHLKEGALELDLDARVDKTYVLSWNPAASPNAGDTTLFQTRGFYKPGQWGAPAVPLSPTRFAVASRSGVAIGEASHSGAKLTFPTMKEQPGQPETFEFHEPPDVTWGWDNWDSPSDPDILARVGGKIQGSTILARMPGAPGQLLLAFPSRIGGVNGFRVYAYDPEQPLGDRFTPLDSIVPLGPHNDSVVSAVIHLTAVDPGDHGPVLLYWTDLTGDDEPEGTVHGRVIFSLQDAAEIPDIAPAPFDLTAPLPCEKPYWYGDYRTAEAFKVQKSPDVVVYRYFPMWAQPWIEPDKAFAPGGSVHYREVTVTVTTKLNPPSVQPDLTDPPPEMIFGECCDFVSLIRRVEREQGNTAAHLARRAMVRKLFEADPNLRDARRRAVLRTTPRRRTQPAVRVPGTLHPKERQSAEEHQNQQE